MHVPEQKVMLGVMLVRSRSKGPVSVLSLPPLRKFGAHICHYV